MFHRLTLPQLIAVLVVIIPSLGGCIAVMQLFWGMVSLFDILLFLLFYVFTLVGVECGFHRYASHKAFSCKPAVHALLLIGGSMAFQGPLLYWVAVHRKHHAFEDREEDPHSPRANGSGVKAGFLGFIRGHFGWLLEKQNVDLGRYSADLIKNKAYFRIHEHYALWSFCSLAVPTLLGFIYYQSLAGAFQGLLWGGLARIFCVHHAVWSVNSLCHLFGQRPFQTKGHSGNIKWLALFTFGGGLHNNHHAFPTTAHNGLAAGEVDLIGSMLVGLEKVGWVWQRQLPDEGQIARKLRKE